MVTREVEVRDVELERRETDPEDLWERICSWEVPNGIRWDTPKRNQGQIVEVSYGTFGRAEAGSLDGWMRVVDQSLPSGHVQRVRYYRRRRES